MQQGIVKCEEFKDYTSHICCEEHPVVVASRLFKQNNVCCSTKQVPVAFEADIKSQFDERKARMHND